MIEPPQPGKPPKKDAALRRTTATVTTVLAGGAFAVVVVLVGTRLIRGGALPTLDAERLLAAKSKWAETAPADYDITIDVQGRQAATYAVQVRDGVVRRATRNGQPLTQPRTMSTWSVPGMFGTISADIQNVQKVLDGTADRSTPQLILRAVFEPDYGYPQRYHRTEKIKFGSNPEVSWQVVNFAIPAAE